jgi:predicted SAM-dependent methyltransferase
MISIELGGGHLVQPGWINLDPYNGEGEWKRFAQDTPWPTGDSSVRNIRASHVMEHIPAGNDRISVMNEAHRVLRRGGVFEIIVPLLVGTWHAVADPTHVSYWVKESFHYFDGLFAPNADYGIKLWQTLELEIVDGWEGHWKGTPQ